MMMMIVNDDMNNNDNDDHIGSGMELLPEIQSILDKNKTNLDFNTNTNDDDNDDNDDDKREQQEQSWKNGPQACEHIPAKNQGLKCIMRMRMIAYGNDGGGSSTNDFNSA
jgi:hypothetical protein